MARKKAVKNGSSTQGSSTLKRLMRDSLVAMAKKNDPEDIIEYRKRGKGIAEAYQRKMQTLIDNHYNNGQERRAFWGSFDDTDISKPAIQKMYYDSEHSTSGFKH